MTEADVIIPVGGLNQLIELKKFIGLIVLNKLIDLVELMPGFFAHLSLTKNQCRQIKIDMVKPIR